MEALIETLTCFNGSFARGHKHALRNRMSYYDDKMLELKHDFYTTTINANDQIKELVQRILVNLKIPKHQWGRYLDVPLTVYDFLMELREHNRKEHESINEFIELIDKQIRLRWKKIIYGGLITLAAAEGSLPFLAPIGGLTALQGLLATALFVPFVGTVYTAALALYSLYQNIYDKKIPFLQRMQNNFFLLARTALKFAGYGILIAAATTATPVVAFLFVFAEVATVLKEVASLVRMAIQDRDNVALTDNTVLSARQHQARHHIDYVTRRNTALINLAAAVISVAIVAVWCFVPGGIFITVALIAAIGFVYLAEQWAHKHNKTTMNTRLQNKFEALELEYQTEQALQPVDELVNSADHSESPPELTVGEPTRLSVDSISPPSRRILDDRLSRPSQSGIFSAKQQPTSEQPDMINHPQAPTTQPDLIHNQEHHEYCA